MTPAFAADATELGVGMIEAAMAAGVRRFVFSGVYQPVAVAGEPREHAADRAGPVPIRAGVHDPAAGDVHAGTSWQPGRTVEHGVFAMPYSKDSAMTFVDYRDVAEVAAIAFATDDLVGGTFELAAGGMITCTRSQP